MEHRVQYTYVEGLPFPFTATLLSYAPDDRALTGEEQAALDAAVAAKAAICREQFGPPEGDVGAVAPAETRWKRETNVFFLRDEATTCAFMDRWA